MRRVAAADWSALEELLRRYEARLFGFFHRLGCDPGACDDLVQAVMIRLYETRRRYRPRRRVAPWIYGIAHNVWRDHLRHRARQRADALGEATADTRAREPDPLRRAQQTEESERVRRALERLPPEQRLTLILRHWQGLTYGEIAEALRVPLGTVKWRIHDAHRKIAEWLGGEGRGQG